MSGYCPDCGNTLCICKEVLKYMNLYEKIKHGSRVTIFNRFGQKKTGKAVILGPAGWVLNMGGKYGTPAIATSENIVKVIH